MVTPTKLSVLSVVSCLLGISVTASGSAARVPGSFGSLGSALVGSAPVGAGPSELAVDPATHTLYVSNGTNDNGPNVGGNTVSVIDTRRCEAKNVSRCEGPWPTVKVGRLPSTIAVDEATDTVYVTNEGNNSVSVFNGATCDALDTAGCGQRPATVPVGLGPIGIFADDANHTVYVANFQNAAGPTKTVSMINSATCNGADLAGCPTTQPPTVNVGSPPDDIDVDDATHTVYVATLTVTAVFDANTCNATVQTGCGAIGRLKGDIFSGPNGFGVDAANNTLYTANYDNTVSAFDLRSCNASDLAGCAKQKPGTVMPFPYSTADHALWLAVDPPLHSVYVAYQRDDALIVVNTNVCSGSRLAACATLHPPIVPTGAQPESVAVDPKTQTVYAVDQTDNDVSVIDALRCDAEVTSGCRQDAPAVPIDAGGLTAVRHNGLTAVGLATDPAVNTLYAATTTSNAVSMINTNTCNSKALAGCAQTPPQVPAGTHPNAVAVDPLTDSVYIANFGSNTKAGPGTVTVIDDTTCNSTDSSGCSHRSTLHVPGGNAYDVAVDTATDTLYVATLTSSGPNLVSVFNGATCNAMTSSGCGQKPVTLSLGYSGGKFNDSALTLAINQTTNTIYATNVSGYTTNLDGQSLYVINGVTCNAAHTTGCSHPPYAFTLGEEPWGMAIDETNDTIYVVIERGGDTAGNIAVINGASCNGSDTSGCARTPPMLPAGFGVTSLAINPNNHTLYTSNHEDASVSVINGATCNSLVRTGCDQKPPKLPARDYPGPIVVDPAVDTAYVATLNGLAVIPLTH